jgi:hypothetical protein
MKMYGGVDVHAYLRKFLNAILEISSISESN